MSKKFKTNWKKILMMSLVIGATLFLVACGGTTNKQSQSGAKKEPIVLKVAYAGTISFNHIPSWLAWDTLAAKGYKIERFPSGGMTEAVQGVASGQAEFGALSIAQAINANLAGGNLLAFAQMQGLAWSMVAPNSIADASQLAGKNVASGAAGQITDIFAQIVKKKYGFTWTDIHTKDSTSRVQGLLAGQLDAAVVDTSDVVSINTAKPGEFHIIAKVTDYMPNDAGSYFFTTAAYAKAHPQVIQDLTDAVVAAYARANTDKAWVVDNVSKFMDVQPDVASKMWDATAEAGIWNPILSKEIADTTMQMYYETKGITDKLEFDKWATEEFYNKATKK